MGKIITVHGTFAHIDLPGAPDDSASSTAYWWRPDSPFNKELTSLVEAPDGPVEITPFVWSGDNSERERRSAGHQLYLELKRLEEDGESYCIVAHSHGGSVVSAALVEAAARKQELPHLKRWITVGTPFVEMRKERFLFMRLATFLKAMYVASFMLLVIFAGAWAGRLISGDVDFNSTRELWRFGIGALLASLPAFVFLGVAWFRERRKQFFYRPRVKERANTYFASRWLALTHEDDEAVRGLGSLRTIDVPIFDRQFAVPVLTLMAVFMLPALYAVAINSPPLMVSLASFLRTEVYELDTLDARADAFEEARGRTRSLRRVMRDARQVADDTLRPLAEQQEAKSKIQDSRRALRSERDRLHEAYPDLARLQRATRFKNRFLERNGQLCSPDGRLCDRGFNQALNANLLLHLVTDEVTSLVVDEELQRSLVGRVTGYLAVVTLVPLLLIVVAVFWVYIVQLFARWFSRLASGWLDKMTWDQVRRAAVGNDTEDEVAVGTAPFPRWAGESRPFLPLAVSAEITQCSNDATFQSLGKFRNALSEFMFMDKTNPESDSVLAYLNWNELIHTSYFCVPSFTRLVATAVSRADGFAAKPGLSQDQSVGDAETWLVELENEHLEAA